MIQFGGLEGARALRADRRAARAVGCRTAASVIGPAEGAEQRPSGAGRPAGLCPRAMELIYGFDPLCGWCYGAAPAIRAVRREHPDLPVRLVMSGLVVGPRAGPYAEAEGYVRAAAEHLREATGRFPAPAFWDLIATPGVAGDSGPPCVAVDAVRRAAPGAALDFAHAVIEAHFERGADLNRPETYAPLLARHAPGVRLPDLRDPEATAAALAEGRALGVSSFPTLILRGGGGARTLRPTYDPDALVRLVRDGRAAMSAAAAAP